MSALLLLTLALLSPAPSHALPGDNCPSEQILWGHWAFNRQYTVADGCLVQVTPINKPGLVYREYVFDEYGRFLVFDSIDGPYETSTAQRNFFLLPVAKVPTMERIADRMVITLANGSRVEFSPDSAFILGVSPDLEIEEDHQIDLTPGGHLSVKKFSGILLDTGWAIGQRKYLDPADESHFLVGTQACALKNETIFQYIDPISRQPHYQPVLMYREQPALGVLLAQRCGFTQPFTHAR